MRILSALCAGNVVLSQPSVLALSHCISLSCPLRTAFRLKVVSAWCLCLAEAVLRHDGQKSHFHCWMSHLLLVPALVSSSLLTVVYTLLTLTCRVDSQIVILFQAHLSTLPSKSLCTPPVVLPDSDHRILACSRLVASRPHTQA